MKPQPEDGKEVALRKESVDRNNIGFLFRLLFKNVALRKESVDRNNNLKDAAAARKGRSPQGERG